MAYYKKHDEGAVIAKYEPWLKSIAIKYRGYGVPMDDLLQEGRLVLLEEYRKWRPEEGASLWTFANKTLHRQMSRHAKKANLGRPAIPSIADIETDTESQEEIDWAARQEEVSRPDIAVLANADGVADVATPEQSLLVKELLSLLDDTELDVIRRCVLEGETLDEVARARCLSTARVQRIRDRALAKMRAHAEES